MQEKIIIDLNEFINKQYTCLVGKRHGEHIIASIRKSKDVKISELEKQYKHIEIIIPHSIVTMTYSFFRGFIQGRLIKLGEKQFADKYRFITSQFILGRIDRHINKTFKNR